MSKYVKVNSDDNLISDLENENFEAISDCIILDVKFSKSNDSIIVKLSNRPFFSNYYDAKYYVSARSDEYLTVCRNNIQNQQKMKEILSSQIFDYIDYYKENSIKDELKKLDWMYKYPLCALTAVATVIYGNFLLIPIGIIAISIVKKILKINVENKLEKDLEEIKNPFSRFYELCCEKGQNLDNDGDKEFYIEIDENNKEYVNTNVYIDENDKVEQKAKTLVKRKNKLTK